MEAIRTRPVDIAAGDPGPREGHRHVYLDGSSRAVHPADLLSRAAVAGDLGWRRIGLDRARRLGLEWSLLAPFELPAPA